MGCESVRCGHVKVCEGCDEWACEGVGVWGVRV